MIATPVWAEGQLAAVLVGGHPPPAARRGPRGRRLRAPGGPRRTRPRERPAFEHQRRDAAHFRSLIESAPDAMIVMTADGIILEANNQVGRLFGYEPDELAGRTVDALTTPQGPARAAHPSRRLPAQSPHPRPSATSTTVSGVRQRRQRIPHGDRAGARSQTPEGLVITATARNVTERREFERRLAHQATHDHLTGLPNRALFVEQLAATPAGAPRSPTPPLAVCFLDVDHFKYVNDSRGHTIGDELVVEVARPHRIDAPGPTTSWPASEGTSSPCWWKGSPTATGPSAYAWRLLSAFDRPFVLDGVECFVTASVGIAFGVSGDDPNDVLRQADAAMYHAKQSGRARVEVFDETLTARAAERLDHRVVAAPGPARRPAVGRLPAGGGDRHGQRPWASRPWCAGSTPSAARCPRSPSSPWPRSRASSCRSADGCSPGRAPRRREWVDDDGELVGLHHERERLEPPARARPHHRRGGGGARGQRPPSALPGARDHRELLHPRPPRRRAPAAGPAPTRACASPSTTSAPGSRRSTPCRASPSTSSRSTSRSSTPWGRATTPSSAPWWKWPVPSTSRW